MNETTVRGSPSARYFAMCSGGVWSAALMVWVLLLINGKVLIIPGALAILGVGVLSLIAGSIGYGTGNLLRR